MSWLYWLLFALAMFGLGTFAHHTERVKINVEEKKYGEAVKQALYSLPGLGVGIGLIISMTVLLILEKI